MGRATNAEVAGTYPGDEFIADPNGGATMATTSACAAGSGVESCGWCRWAAAAAAGTAGTTSTTRVNPAPTGSSPPGSTCDLGSNWTGRRTLLTVVALQPCRTLMFRSTYGLFTTHSFDPRAAQQPRPAVDGVWGFHLRPVGGGTRLVTRTRSRTQPTIVGPVFGFIVGEPVHFAMQTRQFRNLHARVAA